MNSNLLIKLVPEIKYAFETFHTRTHSIRSLCNCFAASVLPLEPHSLSVFCHPHFALGRSLHTSGVLVLMLVGRSGFAFWTFHICPFTSLTIKLKSLGFLFSIFFFLSLVHTLRFTRSVVSFSPCVPNMKRMRFFSSLTHHHNHKELYAQRFYFVGFYASVCFGFVSFFSSLHLPLFLTIALSVSHFLFVVVLFFVFQ